MTKTKLKEFIKIAAICALSIGAFSAAFTGLNNIAFNAATNGTAPLPIVQPEPAATVEMQTAEVQEASYVLLADAHTAEEIGEFVVPNLTVIGVTDHNFHTIHTSAMSMEAAAQIGAEYIWDVFGISIDGMYVTMFYSAWDGHAREHWHGQVFLSRADAMSTESFNPIFWFAIDSITGMRIDISQSMPMVNRPEIDERAIMEWRMYISEDTLALHMMDDDELINYFELAPEKLEYYTQRALGYAERHFNESTVQNIMLGMLVEHADRETMVIPGIRIGPDIDENGELTSVIAGFTFTATDHTGRNAEIMINIEQSMFRGTVHIFTQQNDRIPGFVYTGRGRG